MEGITTFKNITTTNKPSIIELGSNYFAYDFAMAVNKYWLIIMVILGLPGNTLSLLVMLQKHNRTFTTCLYLAALAISDNIVLILGAHFWAVTVIVGGMIQAECMTVAYLFMCFSTLSTWLVVMMTFDRCVAVVKPFYHPKWRSIRSTGFIIGTIFIVCSLVNIPYIFSSKAVNGVCVGIRGDSPWLKVLSWGSFTINCILPFSSLAVMNTLIIRAIQKAKESVASISNKNVKETDEKDKEKEKQLSKTLLLVTFTFLTLTILQYIRHVLFSFWNWTQDPESYATGTLIYHLGQKLNWTNAAVNFILYCVGGSRFRTDLLKLLCREERDPAKPTPASSQQTISSIAQ